MYQQQICPSNAKDIQHMPITLCAHMRQLYKKYTSHELNAINYVTRSVGLHYFTFLTYFPEQICLPH